MPIPAEVDDLEKNLNRLLKELGIKKTIIHNSLNKIEKQREAIKEARYVVKVCHERLKQLTVCDLVSLEAYKKLRLLVEINEDLLLQNQFDLMDSLQEKVKSEQAIPQIEEMISEVRKALSEWGQLLQFPIQPSS